MNWTETVRVHGYRFCDAFNYGCDIAGRLTTIEDLISAITTYTYDSGGNLKTITETPR